MSGATLHSLGSGRVELTSERSGAVTRQGAIVAPWRVEVAGRPVSTRTLGDIAMHLDGIDLAGLRVSVRDIDGPPSACLANAATLASWIREHLAGELVGAGS